MIAVFIIGGIILEIGSIVGSSFIAINIANDMLLELANKGLKINTLVLDEIRSEVKIKTKGNRLGKMVGYALMFIPGVNLIYSAISTYIAKEKTKEALRERNVLESMSDGEKLGYSKRRSRIGKLLYLNEIINDPDKSTNKANLDALNSLNVSFEKLPTKLTFTEIKELCSQTSYNCIIGTIGTAENKDYIAVVGIPASLGSARFIELKNTNHPKNQPFFNISPKQAMNVQFTIYPYLSELNEDDNLKAGYERILRVRPVKENCEVETIISPSVLESRGKAYKMSIDQNK